MTGVWAKGFKGEKNITLAFVLELETTTEVHMEMAAADCYKIFADGKFIGFGPQRAAHGYARKNKYVFQGKRIVIEVLSLYIPSFCWIKQSPFFACKITTTHGMVYHSRNFQCYYLNDRVQQVPRYSYQRGFAEVYHLKRDREVCLFPQVELVETEIPHLLESYVDEPLYKVHCPIRKIEEGSVTVDLQAELWRDRSQTMIDQRLEGFSLEQCVEIPSDEASQFIYHPNVPGQAGAMSYITYDFGRAITGFVELMVHVKEAGSLYYIFDEIMWEENGKGKQYIGFERNDCASVHKWTFDEPGIYHVSTFEPYTVRYACLVMSGHMEVTVSQRDYENPNVMNYQFPYENEKVAGIVQAAKATLAQNAVDILTDCPSRERAGWLSDAYFSSEAERIMTEKNQAEKTFLENYALSVSTGIPEGMVPMCYPADIYPQKPYGEFIPNWAMWYILELEKYVKHYGCDDLVDRSYSKVLEVLQYFETKENEYSVLEDLDGWVFVEWSEANEEEHVKGVNVPSNILYAACLKAADCIYHHSEWREKAERIFGFLRVYAYNDEFFVDNLIRNADGQLVQTTYLSEACQYYAFWFKMITKEEYPMLYRTLMERLGPNRKENDLSYVAKSNVMYGLYMRIDLLMRDGEKEKVLDECVRLFSPMAERTGTLWEHNYISPGRHKGGASCNHGFASYVIKWLLYALSDEKNKISR